MAIKIQSVNFDADKKLLEKVEKKLSKLDTFHDRIIDVEVFLKLDNVVHQIKDKVAEIKVHVPKKTYFTKSDSKIIEDSFDSAYDAMVNKLKSEREIQITKAKNSDHKRRLEEL